MSVDSGFISFFLWHMVISLYSKNSITSLSSANTSNFSVLLNTNWVLDGTLAHKSRHLQIDFTNTCATASPWMRINILNCTKTPSLIFVTETIFGEFTASSIETQWNLADLLLYTSNLSSSSMALKLFHKILSKQIAFYISNKKAKILNNWSQQC